MAILKDGIEFAQGLVLAVTVTHYYDNIDAWCEIYEKKALYFDPINERPIEITIDHSFGSENFTKSNVATVDADEHIKAAFLEYLTEKLYKSLFEKNQKHNDQIEPGCQVEVYKGRTAKGTKGKVIARIARSYGGGWQYGKYWKAKEEFKLGVATSDVMIDVVKNGKTFKNHKDVEWVWERNCRRTDGAKVDQDIIRAEAKKEAQAQFKEICG